MTIANPGPEPDGADWARIDEERPDNTPDSARYEGDHRWPAGPGDPAPDSADPTDEPVKGPGDPAAHPGTSSGHEPKGPGPAQVPGD